MVDTVRFMFWLGLYIQLSDHDGPLVGMEKYVRTTSDAWTTVEFQRQWINAYVNSCQITRSFLSEIRNTRGWTHRGNMLELIDWIGFILVLRSCQRLHAEYFYLIKHSS